MIVDSATVRRKVDEGRAALVAGLRELADDLERLDLPEVGEVVVWLAPHLERLQREADRVFRRV